MTDLTQYRAGFIAKAKHPETSIKHKGLYSNVVEQIGEFMDYEQPPWVSHPMQTLPYMIAQQLKWLEGSR